MAMVIGLPFDVSAAVLSTWLELRELCFVDSAYCSFCDRFSFLKLVGSDLVMFHGLFYNSNAFYKWVDVRRLSLISLSIGEECENILKMDEKVSCSALFRVSSISTQLTSVELEQNERL